MGIIKLKKNKKYSYTPRYYKGGANPFEIKHKFDEHRTTTNPAKGLKGKLNAAIEDYKYNRNENVNKKVLIIVGILVLLFLIVIGFDLSIFLPNFK